MRKSKSSLFLMELIIVILFFSLTSAVCLQVFVKANDYSKQTVALNQASLWCTNVGELFEEYGNDINTIRNVVNSEFDDSLYSIVLDLTSDDSFYFLEYSLVYSKTGESVYSYTFKQHIKEVS